MDESDAELADRMSRQAAKQCAAIYLGNDDPRAMIAKAWMAGAKWMLYELSPERNDNNGSNA